MATFRSSYTRLRRRLEVEELEPRLVLSTAQPTATEQLFLEQLNNARANPAAYGASIGVDLSSVAPSQPLAWDPTLIGVAQSYSLAMSNQGFFGHVTPQGQTLADRLTAAGYPWTSYSESIAAGYATAPSALAALIADQGVPDLGHRLQLLSIGSAYQGLNAVGIGIVQNGVGPYTNYYTIDTASTANTNPYLTGCIYNDLNNNGAYDIGEALAGVTIQVQGGPTIVDFNSGGYSIQLAPGTYTVTFSGGGLPTPITETVTLGTQNVRLNVTPNTLSSAPTPPPSGSGGLPTGSGTPPPTSSPPGPTGPPTPPTPSPSSPNYSAWVTQLGQAMQQPQSATQVGGWVNFMQQGGTPQAVVTSLATNPNYSQLLLSQWVAGTGQAIVGSSFSTTDTTTWVGYLQNGGTEVGFITSLMNTAGYGQLSSVAWINQLCQSLVGRSLTAAEQAAWTTYFQQGQTVQYAAACLINSQEYQQQQWGNWVNQTALAFLGQPLQPADQSAWVTYLYNGGSITTPLVAFANAAPFTQQDLGTQSAATPTPPQPALIPLATPGGTTTTTTPTSAPAGKTRKKG